jgi:acid phosphatase family membrane protein YuiD
MFVWFSLKVLIAATVASAIGQLSKPFTSGKNGGAGAGLDLRTVFRSGGMPSTHSAVKTSDYPHHSLTKTFSFSVSARPGLVPTPKLYTHHIGYLDTCMKY